MAICRYCGQKAGWFSEAHDACIRKANNGIEALKTCMADAIIQGKPYSEIKPQLDKTTAESAIPQEQALAAIKEGWSQGVEQRSKAQPIGPGEVLVINDTYRAAGLRDEDITNKTAGFWAMNFSFLIWTVLHDQIDPYKGPIRFQLQPGEIPFFGIANVLVREERTAKSYVGGYSGVSVRVASGLYYRLGGARGHAVESTSLQDVDYGDFLMTTQAIYFGGTEKRITFRLPYKQIIRFQPYSDAVGICRNGAREQIFAPQRAPTAEATQALHESGWFLFNALQALATKDSETKSQSRSVPSRPGWVRCHCGQEYSSNCSSCWQCGSPR